MYLSQHHIHIVITGILEQDIPASGHNCLQDL